jgi:predicted enzyme related to lactoylglutathione lyase
LGNFKVKRISNIVVPVKSVKAASDFYTKVLGLYEDYNDGHMAGLRIGEAEHPYHILLHVIDEPEPVEKGVVLELEVDDVESAVKAVENSEGKVIQYPVEREWGVKEAVIADLDGYRIWLVEPISK